MTSKTHGKKRQRDPKTGRFVKADGTSKATRSAKKAPKGLVTTRKPSTTRKHPPTLRTIIERKAKKVGAFMGKARMGANSLVGGRLR